MKNLVCILTLLAAFTSAAFAQTYQIAVIPKGTTNEFWKTVHAGAMKAQQELVASGVKVNILWKGPLKEDDREQEIQVVENFVGRGVNGIVLAPLDSKALVAPVESAVQAKIPVVIIDSGLESSSITSFVATDNYKGGQIAGLKLGSLLGGKGKVILVRFLVGSASTEQREKGFLDAIKKNYPGITVISSDQHGGATRDSAKGTAENLLNRFGREVNGIFTCNEPTTVGMLLALRDAGMAGKVKFVGFDATSQLVDAVKSGDIDGLVVQDPLNMAYLGVKTMVAHLRGEKVEPFVDTGVNFVSKANLNDPAIVDLLNPPLDKYLK